MVYAQRVIAFLAGLVSQLVVLEHGSLSDFGCVWVQITHRLLIENRYVFLTGAIREDE